MVFGKKRKADQTQESATEWPRINELLWVRLPCCETAIHPSRVEGAAGDNLIIAAPSKPHTEQIPLPNDSRTFVVGWREGNGSKQVRVQALSEADDEVPTWTIQAVAPPETVQRRAFVRANWDAEITLYLPTLDGAVTGTIVDISEGGVRCTIPPTSEPRTPNFQISFLLDGMPLVLDSEVAWWGTPNDKEVMVGLQFANQPQSIADQLRAFAFDLQMKERRDRHA